VKNKKGGQQTIMKAKDLIRKYAPCLEAVQWVGRRSVEEAWKECDRGDWLLWIAARVGVEHKKVVFAACQCVRLALPRVRAGENRPRKAIETAEAWCKGKAKRKDVRDAAYAALAYADTPADIDAAYAAFAYTDTPADIDATFTSAIYTAIAAPTAARATKLSKCADIVRQHIQLTDVLKRVRGAT
jgi:hypothetical protein